MSSTSTLLKGIYLRPSVQPLGFSEQTSADSLQAGSTSLQAGSRSLQADTGSPQTGSASFQSDPGLPFTATRHRRFLQFFHMKKQKHTSQPDPALEQDHEPGQDPASEQEYAQVAADAQRRKQAQIPTRARTIHDAIRREQLPSLFAELFNAVLFGGRSYIKWKISIRFPTFPPTSCALPASVWIFFYLILPQSFPITIYGCSLLPYPAEGFLLLLCWLSTTVRWRVRTVFWISS